MQHDPKQLDLTVCNVVTCVSNCFAIFKIQVKLLNRTYVVGLFSKRLINLTKCYKTENYIIIKREIVLYNNNNYYNIIKY